MISQFTKLLLIALILAQVGLTEELTPTDILDKHAEKSASLSDVQAQASLNLSVVAGFFPYTEKLNGRYFYLNPNKHRLEFDDAPSYLDKAPSMFRWDLPALEKYIPKVKGPYTSGSHKIYELLYLPRNPDSKTLSISCIFRADNWRMTEQKTSYKDGGSVDLEFQYSSESKLPVLSLVRATVSIPAYSINGGAVISFSQQKVNEGLDKSVFDKK